MVPSKSCHRVSFSGKKKKEKGKRNRVRADCDSPRVSLLTFANVCIFMKPHPSYGWKSKGWWNQLHNFDLHFSKNITPSSDDFLAHDPRLLLSILLPSSTLSLRVARRFTWPGARVYTLPPFQPPSTLCLALSASSPFADRNVSQPTV